MSDRSIISPPSHTDCPEEPCPPPCTATSRFVRRAELQRTRDVGGARTARDQRGMLDRTRRSRQRARRRSLLRQAAAAAAHAGTEVFDVAALECRGLTASSRTAPSPRGWECPPTRDRARRATDIVAADAEPRNVLLRNTRAPLAGTIRPIARACVRSAYALLACVAAAQSEELTGLWKVRDASAPTHAGHSSSRRTAQLQRRRAGTPGVGSRGSR